MATELSREDFLSGPYTWKSMRPCDLSNCTKKQILDYFENSYSLNESIFAALKTKDAFYRAPDRLRLPLIFYYAHTACVYINKLMLAGLIKERVNFEYETLFETGVDEMSWDDTENYRMGGSYQWPSLENVVQFRLKVRNVIRKVIEDTPLELPVTQESKWWALFMGFEHERIHIETSSVLIRQLPVSLVRKPDEWVSGPFTFGESPVKNPFLPVEATEVLMGKPRDFPSYGWDNEYPQLKASVPSFEASKFLITNREFLKFVQAKGYDNEGLWSKEGWKWRTFRQAKHPSFWVCNEGCVSGCGGVLAGHSHCQPDVNQNTSTYRYRSFCEETAIPWDWPVEVNYHEAKAYAAWKGPDYRLPTESEHNAMRDQQAPNSKGTESDLIFDKELHKKSNINLVFGTSTPVNMYPANEKGFHDVFGNVWQWVEDHFNGFPGNETHHLYDDFSSPTYDGHHNIILGGSWMSTGDEASKFARYAFRRHFFQHAGFRLARSASPDQDVPVRLVLNPAQQDHEVSLPLEDTTKKLVLTTNRQLLTETQTCADERLFNEYVLDDINLSSALRKVCMGVAERHGTKVSRALDVGCGCGRLTFELSREVEQVIGLEYCEVFLKSAEEILSNKQKVFYCPKDDCRRPAKRLKKSTHNGCTITAKLPSGTQPSRITMKQFTWIPNEVSGFDLVVHHCLERVQNKKAWLIRLWEILNPNGIVVISGLGDWTREKLEPMVGDKLRYLETLAVHYGLDYWLTEADKETWATVWCLKTREDVQSA
ncbi:ergothioneine biosynthesis protein 1 isoform X2 [Strongylocentrotus purpuratus]|uniref:Sulfatase-modifying factor enzyme-like domain-containing protein n=1 Tax=Strongylocentrotus purpuratus TaxID=7668 RepID=A0A7M7RCT0_STRPU|nr:ergothioneine biosynthesis protein 1 isoform X2 [Strongylocentrotus purpuratus]